MAEMLDFPNRQPPRGWDRGVDARYEYRKIVLNTSFPWVKSHKFLYKGCIIVRVNDLVAIAFHF